MQRPDLVTAVIEHEVKVGKEAEFESWLQRIIAAAQHFAGHRGVNLIRPPAGFRTYTAVLRFDTLEHLQAWLASETRRALVQEAEPFWAQDERVQVKTGLEFWFTPPKSTQPHAKRYKQFLLTLSVIYPLTLIVPWALQPLFSVVPILGLPATSNLLIGAIIVGLMTFVIMPHYTRMMAKWLYR
jgi:antibiotic biosynthesis monooxygenase (ABM) superfamily enzyme